MVHGCLISVCIAINRNNLLLSRFNVNPRMLKTYGHRRRRQMWHLPETIIKENYEHQNFRKQNDLRYC